MKTIKRNFVYNLLLGLSSILFPFITAPYIARVLSPEGVGLFNFANTYSSYFAIVALLGVPTYGIREIAKVRENRTEISKLLSELVSLTVISTLIVSLIYLITIVCFEQLNHDIVIFVIIGIVLYLSPFNINWFFAGFEEFGYITYRSLIIKIISIISIFVFVRDVDDLLIYVIINVFASVANNIWNVIMLYRSGYKIHFTYHGLKKHIKPNLILLASSIAMTLYTVLDTIMLGIMRSYTEVAYYNYASQISRAFIVVVTSLSSVTLPRISNILEKGKVEEINTLINNSYSFVLFLVIPIAVSTALLARTFVPLFLGEQYYGAIVPLEILAGMAIAIGVNNLIGTQGLIGLGYDKYFFYSVICGSVSNLILNFILIPIWGASGAAVSSLVAEFFVAAAMVALMNKKTKVKIEPMRGLIRILFVSITMIPLYIVLHMICDGWIFVTAYCVLAVSMYLTIQFALHDKNVEIISKTIINVIKSRL